MNRQSTEDFQGTGTTLYEIIMLNTYHYAFVPTHRMYNTKSEPLRKLSTFSGCDVSIFRRFLFGEKCATLVTDVDDGWAVVHV